VNNDQQIKPGDEVRVLGTGRSMLVRGIDNGKLRCAWFDGRYYREVSLPRERVRLSSASRDGRLYTF
jgi:uncharacterized protein YodC (DUF2158 family)